MQEQLTKAIQILKHGGIILYPTDTVWGIGCDSSNFDAVEKIYRLKKRDEKKSMICLVSDLKMLQYHIEDLPQIAYDLLKYTERPTTVIYDNPIRVSENLISEEDTLAIRIVTEGFAHNLVRKLGRPIVSTSANISGEATPVTYKEISDDVFKGVDYVVNLHNEKSTAKPSTIIRLANDGMVKIIRK
ncbi:L-threonylcarbamoyladenylate synthase [Flavobacteriaceae bacterium MAR_2010_188]|nr:L-threonylcarbamoyladenylate synthase [Flavobacteriaceae bacterium MAR_2010_188]